MIISFTTHLTRNVVGWWHDLENTYANMSFFCEHNFLYCMAEGIWLLSKADHCILPYIAYSLTFALERVLTLYLMIHSCWDQILFTTHSFLRVGENKINNFMSFSDYLFKKFAEKYEALYGIRKSFQYVYTYISIL